MKRGEAVADMKSLGGEVSWLPAKIAIRMNRGDVVNNLVQNAGGYGDPLLRVPARVARDVRDGKVTPGVARELYGVELRDGAPEPQATERRRAEIRRRRLDGVQYGDHPIERQRAETSAVTHRWGPSLLLTRRDIACAHCEGIIAPLRGNWRETVPMRNPRPEELGPLLALDDRFAYEQYVCPHCAASLWVDVQKRDREKTVDFRLADLD
ncbi:MAG: hypothetical protein M3Y41_15305 [Pseudomonadota bacterium]|nr:hypothetical protein [Pseudomonadota bacterium]